MFEEWSATLTLTEESSRELFKVLKEQDEAFINALLDGKCGFTLKSNDGRSVELVPKVAEQTKTSLVKDQPTTEDCSRVEEKIYKVQMNSKGAPDFSTACEITECDYHKYCQERGQTDCPWK